MPQRTSRQGGFFCRIWFCCKSTPPRFNSLAFCEGSKPPTKPLLPLLLSVVLWFCRLISYEYVTLHALYAQEVCLFDYNAVFAVLFSLIASKMHQNGASTLLHLPQNLQNPPAELPCHGALRAHRLRWLGPWALWPSPSPSVQRHGFFGAATRRF